jgi:hypothetical protein
MLAAGCFNRRLAFANDLKRKVCDPQNQGCSPARYCRPNHDTPGVERRRLRVAATAERRCRHAWYTPSPPFRPLSAVLARLQDGYAGRNIRARAWARVLREIESAKLASVEPDGYLAPPPVTPSVSIAPCSATVASPRGLHAHRHR